VSLLFSGRAFEAGVPFLMWKIPIFRLFFGSIPLLLLACLLLGLAITFALPPAVTFDWLVGCCFLGFNGQWCRNKSSPRSLDKETLRKCWYILRDGVVFDMLLHLTKKLGCQLHRGGDLFSLEFAINGLDFIGVDRVLQEQSEVHEKLMDFRHKHHGQVRNSVRTIAHPGFVFYSQ
jgi:hypothetical protein